ncbi:MAG: hypothetical protein R2876_03650 [Eubacteriales bacterium]
MYYSYNYGYYNALAAIPIILFILSICAFIAALVLIIVFLPEKNRNKYTGFAAKLYKFLNFESLWISPILKVLFMTVSVVFLIGGLIILFIEPLVGLMMIVSSVVVRILFEANFILLSMRDYLGRISKHFENEDKPEE